MIAITGASGLVGGNLVRAYLAQGRSVRALIHKDRRALEGLTVETASADLTNPDSLRQAFDGAETVIHLASSISIRMDNWEQLEQTNVRGTQNVIDACLASGVKKLIYFSSIHAYQQAPYDQPLDENRPLLDGDNEPPYQRSKAAAERLVRQAPDRGLHAMTIVPTAILGPYDFRPSYIGEALQLLAKSSIPMLVQGGYDWVDVRDIVEGTIQAEHQGKNGRSYILSGHWRSVMDVARATSKITGKPTPRLAAPIWVADLFQPTLEKLARINGSTPLYTRAMLGALRSNRQMSHARAAKELGYAPQPFEETLKDTLDWFKKQQGA